MNKLKEFIKSIPLVGWFIRWIYNILRINNTKHKLHILEQKLERRIAKLEQNLNNLNSKHQKLSDKFDAQEQIVYDLVRKHIASQLIYFHQKIDTFIENADQDQAKNLKNNITKDFFDEYYLNFENKFRGTRESILNRYKNYLQFVPFLNVEYSNKNIKSLDIGCGRGEWVQLLQEKGIDSYGIDMNPMMLSLAIENNLRNIEVKDAFEYLKECEDDSFDLITAFHIIEHIPFERLVYLLQEVRRVAKVDATILLETPNPQNLQVAACNFYTDPTHLNPLPSNMIKFLVQYLGFEDVEINYLNSNTATLDNKNVTANNAQDYLIVAKNSPKVSDKVKKKLFFDVSLFHKSNLRTGIHRVVSEQLNAFEKLNQNDFEIIPVYLETINQSSISSEQFFQYQVVNKEHDPFNLSAGDILFTSDLSYLDIQKATQSGLYKSYKNKGLKIVFLVHDILPLQYEDFFVKGTKEQHEIYIKNIVDVADLLITTTEVGKKDLETYCKNIKFLPKIEVLHLGSDFSTQILTVNTKISIENDQPIFLMVGTLEPRKAHKQVIKAFDILWEQNLHNKTSNIKLPILTIIGKQGWLTEDTIKMVKEHQLFNKNLFYIEHASDEELLEFYNKSSAVIIASYAEGFGLPLVEAMHYKKHIIARDIPVFHEIAGDYPIYFKDTKNPKDIVEKINLFLDTQYYNVAKIEFKKENFNFTWEEHIKQLINILKRLY